MRLQEKILRQQSQNIIITLSSGASITQPWQHLLPWALQREKTTLWWGQSSPWISPSFPEQLPNAAVLLQHR